MAKTTKLIGYGISFDMKLVGGAKTADDFRRVGKTLTKSLNKSSRQTKDFELAQEQLNQALQKGAITQKQYEQQLTSLKFKEMKRVERLEKERRAVQGLDQQESLLAKKRQQRARMAGMAASGVSGLGMGGRAAGAARFLGGTAGLGAGAAGLGAGFIGASVVKQSISAFAKLESQVEAMKSLFGENIAGNLNDQFRSLAKTTILTNSQLIENAKIWASYGLTTEGITDRLKRLGTVAGGNSEKFRLLTIAFAQVNAQGKLMGQEKNQLINAGMNLKSVADAAGISMDQFADAMKNGEIKAEHLNEALVNITSEGGMFADYLEKQAETISGKMTILSSSWEEFLVALGKTERGPASFILDKIITATEALKEAAEYFATEPSMRGLEEHPTIKGAKVEGQQFMSTQIAGAPGSSVTKRNDGSSLMTGYSYGGTYSPSIVLHETDEEKKQREINKQKEFDRRARLDDANKDLETLKKISEQRSARERQVFNRMAKNTHLTYEQYLSNMLEISDENVRKDAEQEYRRRFGSAEAPDEDFVGPMPSKPMQDQLDRQFEEDERNRKELASKEEALLLAKMENEKQKFDTEMELLSQQEKEAKEKLDREKMLAKAPSPVSFKAASVEEFMFLRQATERNETAAAVREAQAKNEATMREIDGNRKMAEERRENALQELSVRLSELEAKL